LGLLFGWHPVGFARAVGILLGALNAGLFAAMLRRSVGVWLAIAFGLLGALAPDIWFYAASGMDTLLWTVAAWAWLLWFAHGDRLRTVHVATSGLLLLVRPEAMLLSALCAIRAALELRANTQPRGRVLQAMLLGGLVPCAMIGARYAILGQLVANRLAGKPVGGSPMRRALGGLGVDVPRGARRAAHPLGFGYTRPHAAGTRRGRRCGLSFAGLQSFERELMQRVIEQIAPPAG